VPNGSKVKRYSPDSVTFVSRLKPVAALEIWMTAPAMAAPDGSVTVPVISPLSAADWPWASGWIVAAAPATKARSRIILGIEFLMVDYLFS
jgi:hypothetical protein